MSMALENAELRAQNAKPKRENAEQRGALISLQERIRDLEERLAKNMRNSFKPPLSDGPDRKPPSKQERSKRSRGGQPGHQGHGRALVPAEGVGCMVPCVLGACGRCCGALHGRSGICRSISPSRRNTRSSGCCNLGAPPAGHRQRPTALAATCWLGKPPCGSSWESPTWPPPTSCPSAATATPSSRAKAPSAPTAPPAAASSSASSAPWPLFPSSNATSSSSHCRPYLPRRWSPDLFAPADSSRPGVNGYFAADHTADQDMGSGAPNVWSAPI